MPSIHDNNDGWGPAAHFPIPGLENIPIENLVKSERTARVADFTTSSVPGRQQFQRGNFRADAGEDQDFTLVDTKPPPRPMFAKGGKGKGKGKNTFQNRTWEQGKGAPLNPRTGKPFADWQIPPAGLKGKGMPKGKGKGKGFMRKGKGGKQSFREWSVTAKNEWEVIEEIPMPTLMKAKIEHLDVKKTQLNMTQEDIMWAGSLRSYDKTFDRITPKLEKNLQRYESLSFYNITARDDPVIQELFMSNPKYRVAVSDYVLAALMTAPRSVYSWDLVITVVPDEEGNKKILIDKRDESHIEFLTVNETSAEPPQNDDKEPLNTPLKLGLEASAINQNFSQQVLNQKVPPTTFENPNPFEDEDVPGESAPVAYRYQAFTLGGNPRSKTEFGKDDITVCVRSEIDCIIPDATPTPGKAPTYGLVKCLNEYAPKGTTGWRNCLESQRGAVLATELKNNSFKIARWTAQAVIAGAEVLKFGYVTRKQVSANDRHSILTVQTYKTADFAVQIGLHKANAWGIVRHIVELAMAQEPGRYLLMKDPIKPVMRMYQVPWDEFDEEEEDEEWDGEEEEQGKGPTE